MANRKERRAEKAAGPPELPPVPNFSGTDEKCGNCKFQSSHIAWKISRMRAGIAPPEKDEVLCLFHPGGGVGMKDIGWCSHWSKG